MPEIITAAVSAVFIALAFMAIEIVNRSKNASLPEKIFLSAILFATAVITLMIAMLPVGV